jgi:hypothetical protein
MPEATAPAVLPPIPMLPVTSSNIAAIASIERTLSQTQEPVAFKPEDARLREFAQLIMEGWPEDAGVDGFEIQDAAEKFGLIELKSPAPTEPCGEGCTCDQYYEPKDWGRGVQCYRKTKLLTGDAAMKEPNA